MSPTLIACYFGGLDAFDRLARVLAYTAAKHCPGWDVRITRTTPADLPMHPTAKPSHLHNTQKMEHWYQAVAAAPDGARLLLIDADTMIVRPLDDVWDEPFEFGYTTKPSRFPFNSGVVFVRVTPGVRAFFQLWRDENVRMLREEGLHQRWRAQYGGINQASLGYALDSGLTRSLAIRQLPCVEWNCEDSSWADFDPHVTRIVHVKSALRREVFAGYLGPLKQTRRLSRLWHAIEADMLGEVRSA